MSENPKLFKKYGISQKALTQAILKDKMTTGQFDEGIKRISEKAFQEGFKPREIAEFKKQHEIRLKKAQDDARWALKKRPGMSEYRKKTKGKPSDTGSEYRSGGSIIKADKGTSVKIKPNKKYKKYQTGPKSLPKANIKPTDVRPLEFFMPEKWVQERIQRRKNKKAKGRGMGLQDEKMKPGKIMRAQIGGMGKATNYKKYLSALKEATKKPQIRGAIDLMAKHAKATKYGKIAAGVAGAALLAKTGLEKLYEKRTGKKPFTKRPDKKMGGGMMMRPRPMGYDTGDLASAETQYKKVKPSSRKKARGKKAKGEREPKKVTPKGPRDKILDKLIKNDPDRKLREQGLLPELQRVSPSQPQPSPSARPSPWKRTPYDLLKDLPKGTPALPGLPLRPGLHTLRPLPTLTGSYRSTRKMPQLSKGSSVTVKVKLGRNKPTKLF